MTQTKTKQTAVQTMERAVALIEEAEKLLHGVTAEDLEAAGWAYDGVNKRSMPRNLVYDLYEHATGLRIVREHLFTKFLA